ncbi:MAG: lysozyme inhibitor [Desulfobulbus sp.]|nr:lysozyme inhibitor [Desulfobulbus sp.]
MRKINLLLIVSALFFIGTGCTTRSVDAQRADTVVETYTYVCESGAALEASYPDTDSAVIKYKERVYTLTIAVSASGARYTDDQIEWWTKGSGKGATGSLFQHLADGTSGDLLELCICQ